MNEEKEFTSALDQIDLYSMLRDVLRNLWVIVIGAIAVGMIVNMSVKSDFQSTYSTKTTFVVTSRTSSNYTYSNLSAASSMASSFSNILNSRLLQKKVCQDLELPSFNATTSARVIKGTNLMTLQVTSDSPYNAYRIIRSIMNNITGLTQYVSSDMVMEVLQDPKVPTGADASFTALNQTLKAFALTGAVLVVVFMYLSYRKETIKGDKDLEDKLDAHCLGMVYHDAAYPSLRAFLTGKKNRHLVTDLSAKFEYVERFKKIGANISSNARRHDAKIILVTSVREHEGKSTVSANVALSLAQQAHKVLLIDGDLRRPTLQNLFLRKKDKLPATLGDLLTGKASLMDALWFDKRRKLYLLLNNKNYTNSTDIVSSPNMKSLLESATEFFDFIIIDSPPMSLMADAEVLVDLSDLSVLVVKYDGVLAPDLNDAIDSLRDCRAHFAGCILNDVRTLPGARRAVGGYGGYGRYKSYRRYGDYNAYGKYGTSNSTRSSSSTAKVRSSSSRNATDGNKQSSARNSALSETKKTGNTMKKEPTKPEKASKKEPTKTGSGTPADQIIQQ